jgi:alkanesulfonate monooxygenase SsuD/methylene tetrahydromethanopterin reductase-like flavin-dependent oxidoreductase (luciferase family)
MHDIKGLEDMGIVSVGVASTEFTEAAAAQNRSLGYDPAVVFVPHPIQDRTEAEIRALADRAFDEIVRAVSSSG